MTRTNREFGPPAAFQSPVLSTATAQDGTASTALTFGDRVGTYAVTAACAQCSPNSVAFSAVAELRLVINPSTGSIRPLGTEASPDQTSAAILVTAAGVSVPSDRVANYPVALVSTPIALSGGHNHDGGRPTGHFLLPGDPSTTRQTTGAAGESFLLAYVSTSTGGQEQVIATSAIDPQVQATTRTITVEVPGLVQAESLVGTSPVGYSFTGATSSHTANHFATGFTIAGATTAAVPYFEETVGQAIGLNDMSLISGGVLDVGGDWNPPHNLHRVGHSVDVDRCAASPTGLALVDQDELDRLMLVRGGNRIVESPPQNKPIPDCATVPIHRIHYEFPQ